MQMYIVYSGSISDLDRERVQPAADVLGRRHLAESQEVGRVRDERVGAHGGDSNDSALSGSARRKTDAPVALGVVRRELELVGVARRERVLPAGRLGRAGVAELGALRGPEVLPTLARSSQDSRTWHLVVDLRFAGQVGRQHAAVTLRDIPVLDAVARVGVGVDVAARSASFPKRPRTWRCRRSRTRRTDPRRQSACRH